MPTTTPFGPATTIRAVDADLWARELSSNGLELPDGSGAILGSVTTSAGDPLTGVSVESSPLGAAGPFYDGDGDAFVSDRTGARGVFFVPGIATVSVVNGGVTILDSVVMP